MKQYATGPLLPGLLATAFLVALTPMLSAQATAGHVAASHPVQVELTTKLASKSAKVGDAVDAKLLEGTELGGTTIPKGSKLTGKVTAAKPGEASVTIAFDTLQCKGQAPKPIHASIVSVAPKANLSDSGPSGSNLPLSGPANATAGATGSNMQMQQSDMLAELPVGSSIKNVSLSQGSDSASATLSSGKDFKIDSGSKMEVGLWTEKADK